MKKMILSVLVIGLLVASCSKKENTPTNEVTDSLTIKQSDSTSATSDKVEFTGIFEGRFPCADCPGIDTKLTLNETDNSYILENKYLEKKDGIFTEKGVFEISKDGKCVILKNESNPTPQIFHITKDAAYQVENEEHSELKEEYKLYRK